MPTQREFASHVGVSQQAVSDLVARGILPKGASLDEWRLLCCGHLRDVAAGRKPESQDASDLLLAEKTRLTKAQAEKTELEVGALKGQLIPVAVIEEEWGRLVSATRSHLLAVPSRATAEVAAASGQEQIHGILKKHIYRALEELVKAERRSEGEGRDLEPGANERGEDDLEEVG